MYFCGRTCRGTRRGAEVEQDVSKVCPSGLLYL